MVARRTLTPNPATIITGVTPGLPLAVAELSPDGMVLVVFRLFVDDATLGALAVFERPLHSPPNKTAPT